MSEDEKSDVEEESQEEEQPVYKEECEDFLGDIEDWDEEEEKQYIVLLDSLPFSTILSSYIKQGGEHQLDVYYCGSLSEVKERLLGVLRLNSVVVESFISNDSMFQFFCRFYMSIYDHDMSGGYYWGFNSFVDST